MSRPLRKFITLMIIVSIILGLIYFMFRSSFKESSDPIRIPSYEEIVPPDYNVKNNKRVYDVNEAGVLTNPSLQIVKISDKIISIGCPKQTQECIIKALFLWVQNEIEYSAVVSSRDYIVSAEETILLREGNDLSMSILLVSLLKSQGLDARLGVTPYTAFVQVSLYDNNINLDPACSSCQLGTIRFKESPNKITWVE